MVEPHQKIYFSGETAEIISEIIRKYGLKETDEELDEKLWGEDIAPLHGKIILEITMEVVQGKISKDEMASLLQKQLNTTSEIAEKISDDIKTKLISIATTKNPFLELDDGNESAREIHPPIGIPQTGEIYKPEVPREKVDEQKIEEDAQKIIRKNKKVSKKSTIVENNDINPPVKSEKIIKKQSDTYREPIS